MWRWRVFAFFVVAGVLVACGDEHNDEVSESKVIRPVNAIVVKPVSLEFQRSYPAVVLPAREVTLSFRNSGRIRKLPVRAATLVKRGELIAQLDTRDYRTIVGQLESQKAQAEAQLRLLRSGARFEDISALEAELRAARAQVNAAREQVKRTKTLLKQGIVSQVGLDKDETALAVAEANLRVSQAKLNKGRAGARLEEIEAQKAAIAGLDARLQAARADLADTTLRAPFDGIIARRLVDNFTNVQAKDPIVLLQELATLELGFDAPGPDVARFGKAKNVVLTASLDALPGEEFEAKLVEFSTQANSATLTYRGRVSIGRPEGATILPGMVGSVNIAQKAISGGGIVVPITSVVSKADGAPFVWVIAAGSGAVEKRPVRTGEAMGAKIRILSGLSPRDVIAVAGLSRLLPGMVVRPVIDGGR